MFAVGEFLVPVGKCAILHGTQFLMCLLQFLLPIVFSAFFSPLKIPMVSCHLNHSVNQFVV